MASVETWTRLALDVDMLRWTGDSLEEMVAFTEHNFRLVDRWQVPMPKRDGVPATGQVWDKLHGTWVNVWVGDRVARGVAGEFYPVEERALKGSYARKGVCGVAELKDERAEVQRLLLEAEAELKVAGDPDMAKYKELCELAWSWTRLMAGQG